MTVVQLDSRTTPAVPAVRVKRLASTPARMQTNLVLLVLVALAFGIIGVTGAAQRSSKVATMRTSSGPLAVQAQALYRSLSDADATEASAFLGGGTETPAERARYLDDIATATQALTALSASQSDPAALRAISAGLPTYTGLVETARADNRQGLPVGAAYLREASGEMRTVLLKQSARALYDAQAAQLASDSDDAGGFPWLAVPVGLIVLILLIRAQLAMNRRTHRVFNIGLLSATLAVVVMLGWIVISWTADSVHLSSASRESHRVDLIVDARIDVLQARADEGLTLVARGADPSFDTDFTAMMKQLPGLLTEAQNGSAPSGVGDDLRKASSDLQAWRTEDTKMRALNTSGDYPGAVSDTTGSAKDQAPALYSALDGDLSDAIAGANTAFQTQAKGAAGALTGLAIGCGVLTVVALAGLIIGFQRRIAEYR